MGFSSYKCKHCSHSILHTGSTDEGINDWMQHAVILGENGSRLIVDEFSGYVGEYDEKVGGDLGENVWVHQACWEMAGKPEFSDYDGPSQYAPDQGHFFSTEHDMIDPRIEDPQLREELLREGQKRREQARFDVRAIQVAQWVADAKDSRVSLSELIEYRWSFFSFDDDGVWTVHDHLINETRKVKVGSREDLVKMLEKEWKEFEQGEECRKYLARAEELWVE